MSTWAQVIEMLCSSSHCADCSRLLMKSLCETSRFLPLKHIDSLFFAPILNYRKGSCAVPSSHTLRVQMDAHISSQLPLTPAFVVCKFSSWPLVAFLRFPVSSAACSTLFLFSISFIHCIYLISTF